MPVPTLDGVVAIITNGGKGLELLLESIAAVVKARARDIFTDDEKAELNPANFPYAKLDWDAIANLPKAQRSGGGIPKEQWDAFYVDYIATMPAILNKDEKTVKTAADILLAKFSSHKTNKPVIARLQSYIGMYLEKAPSAVEYVDCIDFLNNKAEALLAVDEAALLEAL